jgi:preprotein translocase subunit YajC
MLEPMFITPAYAQAAGGPAAQGGGLAAFISFAPLILVFAVFWLLMIRPQQQRVKALQRAIDAVKKGDNVVTGGGILGKVTRVEDSQVEVEIAPNTRIRVLKATLTEVINPNSTAAND